MAKNSTPPPIAVGHVTHRADAVRMDDYPLLVYGPAADPRVRVASTGTPIEEVTEGDSGGHTPEEIEQAQGFLAASQAGDR